MAASRRHLAALALILIGAAAAQIVHLTRKSPAQFAPDFAAVPLKLGSYQGKQLPTDQSVFRFLEADAMAERRYVTGDSAIKLSLIYASDWRSIHSPAGCYQAQGWHTITDEQVQIPAPPDSPTSEPLHARLLRVHKNEVELLAMFTFCHPGGTTGDWAEQGWKVATGPPGAGGLVISLSTLTEDDLAQARERLIGLLQQVYPYAVAFWY